MANCPAGTVEVGGQCVPVSDGAVPIVGTPFDSGPPIVFDSGPPFAFDGGGPGPIDAGADGAGFVPPADAGPASGFAVDPAHDNASLGATVASPLTPVWSLDLEGGVGYPVIVGDNAIVAVQGSEPTVRALVLDTGAVAWGPIIVGSGVTLAAEGTRLFGLDSAGGLTAYDAKTGSELWSIQLEGQIDFDSPPVAYGGLVYINGLESGGTTYAVDEVTGEVIWTADTFDGSDGTVAVGGGVVYEEESCDQVSAFDPLTGERLWFHAGTCTGGGGAAPATYNGLVWARDAFGADIILDSAGNAKGSFEADVVPSFHDGTVFYVKSNTLTAVDIATSTVKWSFSGDHGLCTSAVIAGAGGQVFVGSSTGNVYELNEEAGTQTSVSDAGSAVTCGSETQSMALSATHLLVPAGGRLVVY
jgi:outer membrane protein assembly factor BamB